MMPTWETSMSSEVYMVGAKNGLELWHIFSADTNNFLYALVIDLSIIADHGYLTPSRE